MKLNCEGIRDRASWEAAGIRLPQYDVAAMRAATEQEPTWLHFGAGNLFRGFIAVLQQRLLNEGLARGGIVAAEAFDYDIIRKIYRPYDNLALMVGLRPDGGVEQEVIASISGGICADASDNGEWVRLSAVFSHPALQMVSFTFTEKGYALTDAQGALLPLVAEDLANGPECPRHAMSVVAALLLTRFRAGAVPVALVSMDNCSHNGEKLRESVLTVAREWLKKGFVSAEFLSYLEDEGRVSFPWTMIDKITPRPASSVCEALEALGVEGMAPIVTGRGTYIAPFVNAEIPQYLVVEDRFPNGRPPLEAAGVYLTDRETVNRTERMKVTTCLNPLHTALAVYGCLLGYESIAAEMADPELRELVMWIGYAEGMPVVTHPGILDPEAFIREVIDQRLPNPSIPDTPQRIATDTSQKISIRFGETVKAYAVSAELDTADLVGIPLALAGWLRYLLGVNDEGQEIPVSPDPMLAELQSALSEVRLGKPDSLTHQLNTVLSNPVIFGVDLYAVGLALRVEGMFREMLEGPGAVRKTLKKHLERGK